MHKSLHFYQVYVYVIYFCSNNRKASTQLKYDIANNHRGTMSSLLVHRWKCKRTPLQESHLQHPMPSLSSRKQMSTEPHRFTRHQTTQASAHSTQIYQLRPSNVPVVTRTSYRPHGAFRNLRPERTSNRASSQQLLVFFGTEGTRIPSVSQRRH